MLLLSILGVLTVVAAKKPIAKTHVSANVSTYGSVDFTPVEVTVSLDSTDWEDIWVGAFPMVDGAAPDLSSFVKSDYCKETECTSPYVKTAPLGFKYLDDSVKLVTSQTKTVVFLLPHFRTDVIFAVFRGTEDPEVYAKSEKLVSQTVFHHLHASSSANNGYYVIFASPASLAGARNALVEYRRVGSSQSATVKANVVETNRSQLCGFPANGAGYIEQPRWHVATIPAELAGFDGIQVRAGNSDYGWTNPLILRPLTKDATATVAQIYTADMGVTALDNSNTHWQTAGPYTMEGMRSVGVLGERWRTPGTDDSSLGGDLEIRRVFHSGDIAYATGYLAVWDHYYARMGRSVEGSGGPFSAGLLYHANMGNHEEDWPNSPSAYTGGDSGGECGVIAAVGFPNSDFNCANCRAGTAYAPYFTRTEGPVFTIMWDSELDISVGSAQYAWIEATLKAIDRTTYPWVVMFGHRPMYTDVTRDSYLGILEPLMQQYSVSVSLYGHVHNVQVYCPMYNGTCLTASPTGKWVGTIHAVIGNAGMGVTHFPPLDSRTVYHKEEYGFSTLVANTTHLQMAYYGNDDASPSAPFMRYSFTTHV